MELEFLLAKEKIQELQNELKSQEVLKNSRSKIFESRQCQTDTTERKDFHMQATIQLSNITVATQTENSTQEFQALVNIQQQTGNSVQIKQEIGMPNIPNSRSDGSRAMVRGGEPDMEALSWRKHVSTRLTGLSDTQSKKRKISRMSASTSTANETMPTTPGTSPTSRDTVNDSDIDVDESILNSEVYKIYCQNRDPAVAKIKIQNLKNCLSFVKPRHNSLSEEALKHGFEDTRKKLWALGSSKYDSIKKFLDGVILLYQLFDISVSMNDVSGRKIPAVIDGCFTRITMLLPNGYEYWYVRNFESGLGVSKWYRGISVPYKSTFKVTDQSKGFNYICENRSDNNTALLNIIGVSNSMINKLHYEQYLKNNPKTLKWLDFANLIIQDDLSILFPRKDMKATFHTEEIKTDTIIEVKAYLRLSCNESHNNYDNDSDDSSGMDYQNIRPLVFS